MKKDLIALLPIIFVLLVASVASGQAEADVGDLASFGKEAKFFGYASTGTVLVRRDCSTIVFPLGPDDRCYNTSPPHNTVSFDARDIGRILYPQKTFQTIIYTSTRHQYAYSLWNSTTSNKTGRIQYQPYLTLVSGVLNDPALINPQTGLPFNGRMDISMAASRSFVKSMFPNYQENDLAAYGSPAIAGMTKKFFMQNYGLSQDVVDLLFYEKMMFQLNIRGSVAYAEEASFAWGCRFLGN